MQYRNKTFSVKDNIMPKVITMFNLMEGDVKDGDIVRIPLTDKEYTFAQIFCYGHLLAYFDYCGNCDSSLEEIVKSPVLFKSEIYPTVIGRRWTVIGHARISSEVMKPFYRCLDMGAGHDLDEYQIEYIDCSDKETFDPSRRKKVKKKDCDEARARVGPRSFWLIEDELRERFLGLPPQSYDDNGDLNKELKQFLMSTIPGSPAVIGEFGTLGNDQAQDWLNGVLMPTEDLSALQEVLQSNQTGYMQVDDCFEILAAAEVLLALMGKGRKGTKELAEEWLIGVRQKKLHNSAEAKALVSKALTAIDRVLDKDNSELFQLMSAGAGVPNPDWLNGVEDLKARLAKLGY